MAPEMLEIEVEASGEPQFSGLRLTVEEFLELPDDGCKYELVDGVVITSPRAKPPHQRSAGEIYTQLKLYLRGSPVGEAYFEVDVHLGHKPGGGDLVYAPDVIFVRSERVRQMQEKIVGPPDLVVEVISRGSRKMDTITKRADYERFGVTEYWILDPQRKSITFLRLRDGRFQDATPQVDRFHSEAVPGFVLDVTTVRETFEPW